jgi:hypothetical protein
VLACLVQDGHQVPLADASRSRGAICVAQPAREGTRWIADTCHPHNSPPLLRAQVRRQPVPAWADWPDGQLFLGQRGPLTERGIREIVAQLGQAAKLDPAAYGLGRPPASLPAVQALLGHADIATTALYTCASPADLARLLGEPSDVYVALGGIAYNYVADNYIALFIQFIA